MMRRFLVLLVLLWAAPVHATTYYVSKTTNTPAGSDARSCATSQTISTPKATIAAGIACLSAGDTLYVRGGTYIESLSDTFVGHSGTSWANKVVVSSYQSETVWLAPVSGFYVMYFTTSGQQYIEINGINCDTRGVQSCMRIENTVSGNPHHIRYQHAESIADSNGIADPELQEPQHFAITSSVSGATGGNEFLYLQVHGGGDAGEHHYAFYINVDNTLVDHCELYDLRGIALQVYSAYPGNPTPLNATISNNKIHDVTASTAGRSSGIIMDSGNGHVMYNNIIYGLEAVANGAAIRLYGADQRAYNNTVTGNGSTGIDVRGTATDAYVQNNIIFSNGTNYVNAGTRTTCSYNLITVNPSGCTNGQTADPVFTSSGSNDYSIQTSSPAKDHGTTIALVSVDYAGTARPFNSVYDIGAYEFTSVVPDPDVDVPAAGTTFVSDTFTDTAGVNLVSGHTGETGAVWMLQAGATSGLVISDANRVRGSTTDITTNSFASGTPISTEYDVNVPVRIITAVTGHTFGVWGRMLDSGRTGYTAIYNLSAGTLTLWAVQNYVFTQIGSSCGPSFANGSDHTIRLEIRDAIKKLYYDSTFCTKSTDNSIPSAGHAGVDIYTPTTAATNSTSFHLASITAVDMLTDVTPPPPSSTVSRLRFKR